jgi:predicted ATP-grasp superfamily ATP-dependent carboligase
VKGRVLIAGFATRHVARSAWKEGYEVYAVDHFCDQDLSWYTRDRIRFGELEELPDRIAEMAGRHRIDVFIPVSGAETIETAITLSGTDRSTAARLLDKLEVQRFFEREGIPVPPLAGEGEFPFIAKPRAGAGGWRNAVIRSRDDLERWQDENPGIGGVFQKQAPGIPASVSCIADGKRAMAIAANEQMLRNGDVSPFGFIGSITPLDHPLAGRMKALAVKVAAASGCVGSVGIDFVVREEVWAIEVNPRFQATVDTVEASTGSSLFAFHMDACRGELPLKAPESARYAARRILFAERDLVVEENLARLGLPLADIPWPGTSFEDGQAVVSALATGRSREEALRDLDNTLNKLKRYRGR